MIWGPSPSSPMKPKPFPSFPQPPPALHDHLKTQAESYTSKATLLLTCQTVPLYSTVVPSVFSTENPPPDPSSSTITTSSLKIQLKLHVLHGNSSASLPQLQGCSLLWVPTVPCQNLPISSPRTCYCSHPLRCVSSPPGRRT